MILGKTNLSEWANFRGSRSTSGWSGRGGLTKNPYVLDRNPSGSSSGSAAAVQPTCARWRSAQRPMAQSSRLRPNAASSESSPPLASGAAAASSPFPAPRTPPARWRTVRDAAVLLGPIGVDDRDPATEASHGKTHRDYTQFLDADGLKGARIGVGAQDVQAHPPSRSGHGQGAKS